MAKGKKTGGRQKGSLNKTSLNVKESVMRVYDLIGGDDAFADWAKTNKTEFYKITAKLIPRDVDVSGSVRLEDIVAGGDDPDNEDNKSE